MTVILFVCSGNICRSPMAEAMLKSLIPKNWKDRVHISSAGTLGIYHARADANAIAVMREIGIDLSDHLSTGISKSLVDSSNIILVMEQGHRDVLVKEYLHARDKIFLLSRAYRDSDEKYSAEGIADPIGQSLDTFRLIRDQIHQEIMRILPHLSTEIEQKPSRGKKAFREKIRKWFSR